MGKTLDALKWSGAMEITLELKSEARMKPLICHLLTDDCGQGVHLHET